MLSMEGFSSDTVVYVSKMETLHINMKGKMLT